MNYFCDSGGVIFHVDPERVFQGSANANVINFFGAFPSNAEVLLAYQLPDGTWTTPQRMTPIVQLSGVLDGKGNAYAGWQTRIGARLKMSNGAPVTDENGDYVYEPDYTITAKYGTVLVQFFVYANAGNGLGAQIATASSSFLVEKGVPIVLPDTPTDDYEALLGQILAAISDKNLQIDTNAENITALQTDLSATNETVTANGQAIQTLTLSVENGLVARVDLSLNDNYVLTAEYFAKDGSRLGSSQVDFPVESMVVSGGYDNENKTIILTLQNGNVVAIPVGDLVEGLISSTEKGQPNGVATLGADGKVPSEQLPAGQGGAGGGSGTGLFVHTYSYSGGDFKFKILTPIGTALSPVGFFNEGILGHGKSKAIQASAYYYPYGYSSGGTRSWLPAWGFTDDKGTTFYVARGNYTSNTWTFEGEADGPMDASEYVETIEPFTGGNM